MNIEIGTTIEKYAEAFAELQKVATGFIKIGHSDLLIVTEQQESDQEILRAISSLLERALICPDYIPSKACVEKLQHGVRAFIDQSKELSGEEYTNSPERIYSKDFLLEGALNIKWRVMETMKAWQAKAIGHSSTLHDILHGPIIGFDKEKMDWLRAAKLHLYATQKFLESAVIYQKYQHAFMSEIASRLTVEQSEKPDELFAIVADYGDLFDDVGSLALRVRTERILQKNCLRKGDQQALLKHIKTLLNFKDKEPSKAPQVDACISALRSYNLLFGDIHTCSMKELHAEALFWREAIQRSGRDEKTCDTLLANPFLVGSLLNTLLKMELIFDRCFRAEKEALFKEGKKEKVVDTIVFQQNKRTLFLQLMENGIHQHNEEAEKNVALYCHIDQKMRAFISKLPNPTVRKRVKLMAVDTLSLSLWENEKPRLFQDLSPKEYVARNVRILRLAKPVVTEIDVLIDLAKSELQKAQEQKVISSVKSLSLKTEKTPSKKPLKKTPAKRVAAKTDTVAQDIIVVTPESASHEEGMRVVGTRAHPKVAHSPLLYHPRVTRWWSDAKQDDPFLQDEEYRDKGFSQEVQELIRAKHNFGLIVDQFAKREGIEYENGQLALIGEITIGGKTRRGVFGYAHGTTKKDKDLYYHRFFTEKTASKIIAEYANQGGYKLDGYAEEQKAEKGPVKGLVKSLSDDGSFVQDITDDVITISDPKNKMTIKLCRFQEQE